MLALVDGVVVGGEGSCDQVLDAMSKVQSSEFGLWICVSLLCYLKQKSSAGRSVCCSVSHLQCERAVDSCVSLWLHG
jgi:hypothetical protein